MSAPARSRSRLGLSVLWAAGLLCCAGAGNAPDPLRYRLADSGSHWDRVGDDAVLEDLTPRYPEFFELVLDPSRSDEPDLLGLRDDLERSPVDRRNFDALNAVAVGYFETLFRQEAARADASADLSFLGLGFRSAKLVAVPWRAYGEIEDAALRDAILDFFEDAGSGEKQGSLAAIGRLPRIVDSLVKKEGDADRRRRIESLRDEILARAAPAAD